MQDQLTTIEDYLARREVKKAEVLIAKLLRADPATDRRQLLLLRARTRLLSARPDDAISDLMSIRSDSPDAHFLELLGDAHFARFELASVGFADRNDAAEALSIYRHILDVHPSYENAGWIFYQMGRVLLTDNQVEQAVTCFYEGLLSPSNIPALTAYCYERLAFVAFYEWRNLSKALGFINKAIDTYPNNEDRRWLIQVHVLRSRVLRDMHRYDQALKAAETALAVASSSGGDSKMGLPEALLMIAELFFEMGRHDREVITYLQQFLQMSKKPLGIDVTWSRVHEMLGDTYFKTGQYLSAATAYQAALQFNPYHPWEISLHYRIARAFYQQGDYDRAIQSIHRMLDAAREDGESVSDYRVYDVLGNAQFALGKYGEALAAYRTALQVAPPNADNLDKIRAYHDFAQDQLSRAL